MTARYSGGFIAGAFPVRTWSHPRTKGVRRIHCGALEIAASLRQHRRQRRHGHRLILTALRERPPAHRVPNWQAVFSGICRHLESPRPWSRRGANPSGAQRTSPPVGLGSIASDPSQQAQGRSRAVRAITAGRVSMETGKGKAVRCSVLQIVAAADISAEIAGGQLDSAMWCWFFCERQN